MLFRVGADQRNHIGPEVRSRPSRPVFRVVDIGATARMGDFGGIDQRGKFAFLDVDHGNLVGGIGRHHEIALAGIVATIVQELGGIDRHFLEVGQVGIIDHLDHAGFLDADQKLRLGRRGDDGGDPRFLVIIAVDRDTPCRHVLQRLQGQAIENRVLRRPVGTDNRVLVLETLGFGSFDRTRLHTGLDGGDHGRFFKPEVDHVEPAIAPDNVDVAARQRHAGNMHGVAGLDDAPYLLGITVDQRHLAGIAQRHREDVVQIDVVHLFGRPLVDRHMQLPGAAHVGQAPLGRRVGRHLDIGRHVLDFILAQDIVEVRHAPFSAVTHDFFQPRVAQLAGVFRFEIFARRTFAQHAVAAGATLEIRFAASGLGFVGQTGRIGGKSRREREWQGQHDPVPGDNLKHFPSLFDEKNRTAGSLLLGVSSGRLV